MAPLNKPPECEMYGQYPHWDKVKNQQATGLKCNTNWEMSCVEDIECPPPAPSGTCCWNKFYTVHPYRLPAAACDGYPSDHIHPHMSPTDFSPHGGRCTTNWATRCNRDYECPILPPPTAHNMCHDPEAFQTKASMDPQGLISVFDPIQDPPDPSCVADVKRCFKAGSCKKVGISVTRLCECYRQYPDTVKLYPAHDVQEWDNSDTTISPPFCCDLGGFFFNLQNKHSDCVDYKYFSCMYVYGSTSTL